MRLVTKRIHAFLDYPVAAGLILFPFLLGLGSSNHFALFLSVGAGIAALILTLFTDHDLGLIRIIPYRIHLLVDLIVGMVFILAPFILGFKGMDAYYYWIMGGTVLTVVTLLNNPEFAYS